MDHIMSIKLRSSQVIGFLAVAGMLFSSWTQAASSAIQILSPLGGEQWAIGSNQNIKWSAPASVSSLRISLNYPEPACRLASPPCMIMTRAPILISSNVPNTGSYSWNIGSNFSAGSYFLSISDAGNSGQSTTSDVFNLLGSTDLSPHPYGTNISAGGVVYYIQAPVVGGAMPINPPKATLRPYSSQVVFLSYGFNSWSSVVPANNADLALEKSSNLMPYADGTLVNDSGTIYIINSGGKTGFANPRIFLGLGYSWQNVIFGDTSFVPTSGSPIYQVAAHPAGTLVNQKGIINLITAYGKMGIPSMEIFNSWGLKLNNVVSVNFFDEKLQNNSYNAIVSEREFGQLSPTAYPPVPMSQ